MLDDKMVRLRLRREQQNQPIWAFVGKVLAFTGDWLEVRGKGILVFKRDTYPPERRTLKSTGMVHEPWGEDSFKAGQIDEEARTMVFPREIIANIRLLPDDFDLEAIALRLNGRRIDMVVSGGPDSALGEVTED